jgi:hypothetical protein
MDLRRPLPTLSENRTSEELLGVAHKDVAPRALCLRECPKVSSHYARRGRAVSRLPNGPVSLWLRKAEYDPDAVSRFKFKRTFQTEDRYFRNQTFGEPPVCSNSLTCRSSASNKILKSLCRGSYVTRRKVAVVEAYLDCFASKDLSKRPHTFAQTCLSTKLPLAVARRTIHRKELVRSTCGLRIFEGAGEAWEAFRI